MMKIAGNVLLLTILFCCLSCMPAPGSIFQAAADNDIKTLIKNIKYGVDINKKDGLGQTPLHIACLNNRYEAVSFLLDNQADVNARDNSLLAPLHYAAMYGTGEMVELLIQNKADLSVRDNMDSTPLHRAINNFKTEVLTTLLSYDVQLDSPDSFDRTPLYLAAEKGKTDMVKALLLKGANANLPKEQSPLHIAARKGYKEIIALLIQYNAEIDAFTAQQATSLMLTITSPFIEDETHKLQIIKLLVEAGADLSLTNHKGESAIDLAGSVSQHISQWLTSQNSE